MKILSLRRIIVTDHGSFVLLNVYVPNAGRKGESITERADLKIRFLHALKEKCDAFRENDRKVFFPDLIRASILHMPLLAWQNWM